MPTPPSSNRALSRGYLIALTCAAFLSTTAIFIRHLTQTYHIPPLVLAFWRDCFVVVTLFPVLGLLNPSLLKIGCPTPARKLLYLCGYGLILAIFNIFWTLSVALNGAAVATVLVYCSAAFTAILGHWFLRESLGWAKLLAIILSLGGCALVSGVVDPAAWRANLIGISAGILSGLSYAGYSLMGRSAANRGLNPWTTLFYTFGCATLFLLVVNLIPGPWLPGAAARPADLFWLKDALTGWAVLFALAAVPTVLGFGLYNVSLGYLPAGVVNLIATTEPVFTTVIAYVLLGERLNGVQIGGGLLILGGVVFLRIYEEWAGRRPENAGKITAAKS